MDSEQAKLPEWAIVGRDVAEAEFLRWAKAMGLQGKLDEALLSAKEVEELRAVKHSVLCAIMDGRLTVTENGEFLFRPADVGSDAKLGELLFSEPTMADVRDATKKDNKVEQQIALLCKMTGKSEIILMKMRSRNSSVANAIVGLFLG